MSWFSQRIVVDLIVMARKIKTTEVGQESWVIRFIVYEYLKKIGNAIKDVRVESPHLYILMLVGDLVNGEIDIAVAGMTMTSEREEVKI